MPQNSPSQQSWLRILLLVWAVGTLTSWWFTTHQGLTYSWAIVFFRTAIISTVSGVLLSWLMIRTATREQVKFLQELTRGRVVLIYPAIGAVIMFWAKQIMLENPQSGAARLMWIHPFVLLLGTIPVSVWLGTCALRQLAQEPPICYVCGENPSLAGRCIDCRRPICDDLGCSSYIKVGRRHYLNEGEPPPKGTRVCRTCALAADTAVLSGA